MFDLLHFDSRNFHVHRAINIHERLVGLITYFTYFGGIVVPLWMVDWKRWSCFLIEIQWGNMFSSNTYHYCLTVNNHMSKIYKYRMNPTGICFLNVNLLNFSFKILSITRKRYIFFFKRNTLHDSCIHKNVFEPVSPKKKMNTQFHNETGFSLTLSVCLRAKNVWTNFLLWPIRFAIDMNSIISSMNSNTLILIACL